MQTHLVFPTPIVEDSIDSDLEQYVMDLSRIDDGVKLSNKGGYQSKHFFKPEKEFEDLWEKIEKKLNHFHKDIAKLKGHVEINEWWFNINYKHNYNVSHTHPGCVLAGVFWVSCPKQSGELVFHHLDEHNFAPIQHTNITIPPVEGGMYLFPGSLYHHVSMSYSDEPRMSIAFNLLEP